jgi:predicted alpha-1,6-mannanase (GH76 family)
MRLALAFLAALTAALSTIGPAHGDSNAYRAAVSFWAMRHEFLDPATGAYRETAGTPATAHAWPYSQALAATIAMTTVPQRGRLYVREAERRIQGLERYARGDGAYKAGAGDADVYYDDNEWIALELVQWWKLRGDRPALARAARLFGVVRRAWDPDETHPCPGGVFWTNARGNDDRNTVTTATGALLAMKLYEATHSRTYVIWARRMLTWVESCMRAPDGLLWDHIGLDGLRDETHWSYNQGTVIGANVLLYRLTGDAAALRRAEELADGSLAYFDRTPGGHEPPYFLAIFFRNLLALAAVDGNNAYRDTAQAYADAAWEQSRVVGTNVFRFSSQGPPTLLEQAAMVQIYAALTNAP